MKCEQEWICEITSLAVKTVLVKAHSRSEALELLKNGQGEGIEVTYGPIRSQRVVRRDGYRGRFNSKENKEMGDRRE